AKWKKLDKEFTRLVQVILEDTFISVFRYNEGTQGVVGMNGALTTTAVTSKSVIVLTKLGDPFLRDDEVVQPNKLFTCKDVLIKLAETYLPSDYCRKINLSGNEYWKGKKYYSLIHDINTAYSSNNFTEEHKFTPITFYTLSGDTINGLDKLSVDELYLGTFNPTFITFNWEDKRIDNLFYEKDGQVEMLPLNQLNFLLANNKKYTFYKKGQKEYLVEILVEGRINLYAYYNSSLLKGKTTNYLLLYDKKTYSIGESLNSNDLIKILKKCSKTADYFYKHLKGKKLVDNAEFQQLIRDFNAC
ncbi:MAG: hypothetical protein AAFY76_25385, partial [Cyanobacteria bacterium J06649_11]